MAGLSLDSGALIALEKGKREVWALVKEAVTREVSVMIPTTVIAQTWRKRLARVATLLKGSDIIPLDDRQARRIGLLLGKSRQKDIVDAHVLLVAAEHGCAVVTADPSDLEPLASQVKPMPRIIRI